MPKARRVAIMLDLDWPYKRHAGIFTETQQYAQENGWEPIVDDTPTIRCLPRHKITKSSA